MTKLTTKHFWKARIEENVQIEVQLVKMQNCVELGASKQIIR